MSAISMQWAFLSANVHIGLSKAPGTKPTEILFTLRQQRNIGGYTANGAWKDALAF